MKKAICLLNSIILAMTMLGSITITATAASTDVLNGKSVLVIGDDISAGHRDDGKKEGWCSRLKDVYGMSSTPMHSGSGVTISDWRKDSSGSIISQIPTIGNYKYDYILLHGGMADAEKNNTGIEGVVPGAVFPHNYTIPDVPQAEEARTFAKGMERLIVSAIKKFNGARIGFIINYATPNNSCENARDMEKYWSIARQVCEKWDVPYLDLYAGKTADGKSYSYDILDMDNAKSPNHNNGKHLKAAGYDVITPYIAEWMTTIQPYNLNATLATAPTTTTSKRKTTTTTTTTAAGSTTTTTSASVIVDNTTTTTATASQTEIDDTVRSTSGKTSATSTSLLPDSESSALTEDITPEETVEDEGADIVPIVITSVTVAASLAVLIVLIIVIFKRFRK